MESRISQPTTGTLSEPRGSTSGSHEDHLGLVFEAERFVVEGWRCGVVEMAGAAGGIVTVVHDEFRGMGLRGFA